MTRTRGVMVEIFDISCHETRQICQISPPWEHVVSWWRYITSHVMKHVKYLHHDTMSELHHNNMSQTWSIGHVSELSHEMSHELSHEMWHQTCCHGGDIWRVWRYLTYLEIFDVFRRWVGGWWCLIWDVTSDMMSCWRDLTSLEIFDVFGDIWRVWRYLTCFAYVWGRVVGFDLRRDIRHVVMLEICDVFHLCVWGGVLCHFTGFSDWLKVDISARQYA